MMDAAINLSAINISVLFQMFLEFGEATSRLPQGCSKHCCGLEDQEPSFIELSSSACLLRSATK